MKHTDFTHFNLSPEITQSLVRMGFTTPTEIQEQAIPIMTNNKDVLAQAPTGTGKTAAFGIPLLEKINGSDNTIKALILTPTRELTLQITEVLRSLSRHKAGIRIVSIYGGERIERQMNGLKKKPQIIVATPGRLLDHLQRKTISLSQVETVVLDEADQMLDMGFRPDLNKILRYLPKERQTVLFSATLSNEIKEIAKSYTNNPEVISVAQKALTVDSVKQHYAEVEEGEKTNVLLKLLAEEGFYITLIFTNTKRMADRLAREISFKKIKAEALHGDLRQTQRDRIMARYRKGDLQVLVATDVAARGIDVSNVSAVINYDVPLDNEAYIHRIGRTGRAEETGLAYTLIYPHERSLLLKIMNVTKANIEALPGTDPEALRKFVAESNRRRNPKRKGSSNRSGSSSTGGQGQHQGRRTGGPGGQRRSGGGSSAGASQGQKRSGSRSGSGRSGGGSKGKDSQAN